MSHKRSKRERRRAESLLRETFGHIMTVLRQDLAAKIRAARRRGERPALPCETCAFRAWTDKMPGYERTVLNLVKTLAGRGEFYCHRDMPVVDGDYKPPATLAEMESCAGWEHLRSYPEFEMGHHFPAPLMTALAAFEFEGRGGRAVAINGVIQVDPVDMKAAQELTEEVLGKA